VRRDLLDHVIVLNQRHLRRLLKNYVHYYHEDRTHLGLEKLWKAAYVFHPEGSPEAELWVRIRTLRVLGGRVSQVVKGLRQSVTKLRLRGVKRKTLLGVAGYLYRNRTRMRYDQFLAKGWPIASGPVEGCLQESDQRSHGAIGNALDRGHGRGHRQAESHLPERGFRSLLVFSRRKRPASTLHAVNGASS
jgi:hypothetical protein